MREDKGGGVRRLCTCMRLVASAALPVALWCRPPCMLRHSPHACMHGGHWRLGRAGVLCCSALQPRRLGCAWWVLATRAGGRHCSSLQPRLCMVGAGYWLLCGTVHNCGGAFLDTQGAALLGAVVPPELPGLSAAAPAGQQADHEHGGCSNSINVARSACQHCRCHLCRVRIHSNDHYIANVCSRRLFVQSRHHHLIRSVEDGRYVSRRIPSLTHPYLLPFLHIMSASHGHAATLATLSACMHARTHTRTYLVQRHAPQIVQKHLP